MFCDSIFCPKPEFKHNAATIDLIFASLKGRMGRRERPRWRCPSSWVSNPTTLIKLPSAPSPPGSALIPLFPWDATHAGKWYLFTQSSSEHCPIPGQPYCSRPYSKCRSHFVQLKQTFAHKQRRWEVITIASKTAPANVKTRMIFMKLIKKRNEFHISHVFMKKESHHIILARSEPSWQLRRRDRNRPPAHGSLEGVGSVHASEVCHSKTDILVITEIQLF